MEILILLPGKATVSTDLKSFFKKLNLFLPAFLLFVVFQVNAQKDIINAFEKSYELEKSEDYQEAAEKLKPIYRSDGYEINLRLGWLYYLAGQIEESIDYYQKAIDLKPYAIEPKLGLVLPLSMQGGWDQILAIYQKILQNDPQNVLVNYRLGLIYYNRGNFEKADPYLEKVVNLYPFDYDGLLLLAWNKLNLQKTRESKVLFQKVLMNSPGDESALEGLSLIK